MERNSSPRRYVMTSPTVTRRSVCVQRVPSSAEAGSTPDSVRAALVTAAIVRLITLVLIWDGLN